MFIQSHLCNLKGKEDIWNMYMGVFHMFICMCRKAIHKQMLDLLLPHTVLTKVAVIRDNTLRPIL